MENNTTPFKRVKPPQTSILVDLDLPFEPDIHNVFYVENEYNPAINEFIQEHYKDLQQRFLAKDVTFCYLPKLSGHEVPGEVLRYMFPYLPEGSTCVNADFDMEVLKSHIISGAIEGPALIHFIKMPYETGDYLFTYRALEAESEMPLMNQFEWYIDHITLALGGGRVYYSTLKPEKDEVADYDFDDDEDALAYKSDQTIADEIRERIKELRKRGIQLYLMGDLVEEQPTLSRLVIDRDYRIFLTDYHNVEITMSPLPKAVFILFLKHPEGIPFKQLGNYYSELLDVYKRITNRNVEKNICDSIHDITDPTKNSINEKCARIKEAFVKHFDSIYAQHYYVTGKRGEPKKITLPRELVDLQGL